MKTIAFCNSTLAWGGGENWHLDAALFMANQGYHVIVMAHEDGALYQRAKEHVSAGFTLLPLSIGRLSFLNPLVVGRYAKLLRDLQVDTVIMNLPQDLKCIGLAAKKAGVAHVIYRRGSALPVRNSLLNRYLYGQVLTGLIVNSKATYNEVYRHNARLIPSERVILLSNGIDIASFEERLKKAEPLPGFTDTLTGSAQTNQQKTNQQKKGPIILGNAGRLNKQKGQQYLLYLAHCLDALAVDYRVIIAGGGERREELEDLAQKLGVAERVTFCGFLEDTATFWKSIDIFVLTSLWEGFGYVLLEAMLSKKPILAFGVSNIPELVEEGKNGFLFPLPEEAAPNMLPMAKAVQALAQDAELRERMGVAGHTFAKPAFDQSQVMERLMYYLNRTDY